MSTSETREIERKYAVPDNAPVPSVEDVGPIDAVRADDPLTLDATYFDTDGLALLNSKITLRKRVGGSDEGWHLKLPGDGYRRELHHRLTDGDEVPGELLVHLHVALRGRTVAPVVRLTTSRTVFDLLDADGERLAELCDDLVTSTPQIEGAEPSRWREWEVELHDGDPKLLDAVEPVLLEAGASTDAGPSKLARALGALLPEPSPTAARPANPTIADVARHYLTGETTRLKEHDAGVRLHADDAVHQMRVAARRLRSVLSSYRRLIPGDLSQTLRGELKALADSLGGARDNEVMLARLLRLLDEQPADGVRGPVRERIVETLEQRYNDGHAEAMRFMTSQRYYSLLDSLDALVQEVELTASGSMLASDGLVDVFDRDWKRLRKAVRHVESLHDRVEREEALHEVRKAAKRLRYGMDSISDEVGRPARRIAKAASAITEILGDHNDSVITSSVIGELAAQAFARGEDTFTYGRMQGIEDAGALVSQDDYRDALQTLNHLRFDDWKSF